VAGGIAWRWQLWKLLLLQFLLLWLLHATAAG
jgi:hypothetical protein